MPNNIAILGSAPSSRLLAPFDDPEWEIWACSSDNLGVLPKVDVWIEIHSLVRKAAEAPEFVQMLAQHPCVFLQEENPMFKGSHRYPIEEMLAKYGEDRLTSSAAFLMALAINREPKTEHIRLFGLDMTTTPEYAAQRPGMKMMIEKAKEAGIKVTAPGQCDLLTKTPLYGYRESWPMFWKLKSRQDQFNQRLQEIERVQKLLHDEHCGLTGALQDSIYNMRVWLKPEETT